MEQLEAWFDLDLGRKSPLHYSTDQRPVHVVRVVFAIAISVQLVLVFKRIKQIFRWILHCITRTCTTFIKRVTLKVYRRQETSDDVVNAIPVICRTLLPELRAELISGDVKVEDYQCLLNYTLRNYQLKKLPPSLLLKSAISWLLYDLLLLLSRCNRYRLPLQWQQRPALTYRTIDHVSRVMEKLAYDVSKHRVKLPVILASSPNLLHLQMLNTVPVKILDLHRMYTCLQYYIPLLIMPKRRAIRSKYDHNLEQYKRRTSVTFRGRTASYRGFQPESPVIDRLRQSAAPSCVLSENQVAMDDENSLENLTLSVTSLAAVLKDPSFSDAEKCFIIRGQRALRNVNSPKKWKWRSALTYMERRMTRSSSTQATGTFHRASTPVHPKHYRRDN